MHLDPSFQLGQGGGGGLDPLGPVWLRLCTVLLHNQGKILLFSGNSPWENKLWVSKAIGLQW